MGATTAAAAARAGQDFHRCDDWLRYERSLKEPERNDEPEDITQSLGGPPVGKTFDLQTPPRK